MGKRDSALMLSAILSRQSFSLSRPINNCSQGSKKWVKCSLPELMMNCSKLRLLMKLKERLNLDGRKF